MEDWRYENLKDDVKRLREEIREVKERTYKVENWQFMLPLRVMMGILWLVTAGIWVFGIAAAIAHSR